MQVLITGANGFIGKNLRVHLAERSDVEVFCFTREQSETDLNGYLEHVDFVFHLAGINRCPEPAEFFSGNQDLTQRLCKGIVNTGRNIPVVFSSSIQAGRETPYGLSKQAAENALFALQERTGVPVHVFRLPNVFGKWCKPNYNSAIATFCHNIARGLPIQINDPAASVTLAYVDDVVSRFLQLMDGAERNLNAEGFECLTPQYTTTVGQIVAQIEVFRDQRAALLTAPVGTGLTRALYSTYLSHLPTDRFAYEIPRYQDSRGVFAEMLKTPDCGQFSFFTAHPGVTRGGHYHHSKAEKFLVIKGKARFRFRHLVTKERLEFVTDGDHSTVVETIPGWAHDITNIGTDELIVLLWANEVFDRDKPDTIAASL